MTDLLTRANPSLSKVAPPRLPSLPARLNRLTDTVRLVSDPFSFMKRVKAQYGDLVSMDGFPLNYTFALNAEYTRQMLTNPGLFRNGEASEYPFRPPADSALARMTLTLNAINGDLHKQQRRLMMPAFHRKRVETYRDVMVELTNKKLDEWQSDPDQPRDMLREMKQLTMAVAVKTLLGLDPDRDGNGETSRRLVERWVASASGVLATLLPFDWPGTPFRRILRLSEEIEKLFKDLIAERRAQPDGDDVLSTLIAARDEDGTGLSEQDLVSQTLALFVAGHETTATALTWTLFLLSQHPRVMSDLVDELEGNLHGSSPTVQNVNDLTLLDRVVKESMRIISPFVFGMRFNAQETDLGSYRIPAHTMLVFAPAILHHDPAVYPQPRRFRPERWETLDPTPYQYLPFSSGPRMCIGATFATLEIKLILAATLQRYRLTLAPNARIDRAGLLLTYPRHGLPMLARPQDHQFGKNPARGNINRIVDCGL